MVGDLRLVFAWLSLAGAALAQPVQPVAARPGEVVEGVIHREGDERYRLAFGASGAATVEVSGAPADCALQVGNQGFQESDSSPSDWTDGRPGETVRHTFQVQAGRPGTIWVMLRSRTAGVGANGWSAVSCSNNGPYYATPERGGRTTTAPGNFEGRPVRGPIAFRLLAWVGDRPSITQAGGPGGAPGNTGRAASLRDDRLGFSMEYPADWSAAPGQSGTFRLTGGAGARAGGAVVTVTVIPKSSARERSEMELVLGAHQQLVDRGAELVKLGPVEVGGQTAAFASHIYDEKDAGGRTTPFDHVQLAFDHGGNYYLISFEAPHDVFVQQTPAFKQMFGSWRFLR